jgi:hypothetical protein
VFHGFSGSFGSNPLTQPDTERPVDS